MEAYLPVQYVESGADLQQIFTYSDEKRGKQQRKERASFDIISRAKSWLQVEAYVFYKCDHVADHDVFQ